MTCCFLFGKRSSEEDSVEAVLIISVNEQKGSEELRNLGIIDTKVVIEILENSYGCPRTT